MLLIRFVASSLGSNVTTKNVKNMGKNSKLQKCQRENKIKNPHNLSEPEVDHITHFLSSNCILNKWNNEIAFGHL